MAPPPEDGMMGRALRLAAWNAGLALAGLCLIVLAGEAWLRLTRPFMHYAIPMQFMPQVGLVHKPGAEVHATNARGVWTVSRANRWGFLDRPPHDGAAAGCHVSLIGDSFVDAMQVPIADKLHVRLEALAGRRLAHLDVTTSAFGINATGQIAQLAFYDAYARRLRPKLLVLVFVGNDFQDNSPILTALRRTWDPDRLPSRSVARGEDGALTLRPPEPEYRRYRLLPNPSPPLPTWMPVREPSQQGQPSLFHRAMDKLIRHSWLAKWLTTEWRIQVHWAWRQRAAREALGILSRRAGHEWLAGEDPARLVSPLADLADFFEEIEEPLSPLFEQAVVYTGFALDEFKARAERDGAALVILATNTLGRRGDRLFDLLDDLAEARGIPVVDQRGWIDRQGRDVRDATWAHDGHWNPIGHLWAAEALLEYLVHNQDVCRGRSAGPGDGRAGSDAPIDGWRR